MASQLPFNLLLVFGSLLRFLHALDILVIVADAVDAPAIAFTNRHVNMEKRSEMKSYINLEMIKLFYQ